MHRVALTLCLLSVVVARLDAATLYHDPLFGVQTIPDVTYGQGLVQNGASSENLLLDVYRPMQVSTPLPAATPAIVLVHGGGFVSGDKADMAPLAEQYASLGYVVVSIDYRLYADLPPNSSPGPADNFTPPPPGYDSFPDLQLGGNAINAAVQDAETAMNWLRSNAATYGVDPNRIGIGGASAGGITAELVGYNDLPAHTTPNVVLDFLGSMYGTQGVIHAGAPPAFMFHGNADTQVPFDGDLAVSNQLTAVGVYHEFYEGVGIGHELDTNVFNMQFGNETLLQHNIDFLANHLVPEPSAFALAAMGAALGGLAVDRRRRARLRRLHVSAPAHLTGRL
ncbi:MAG TPA: alpha/beta hydrolase [Pirellulales bacterium]|nr:alpha/beta hydrolase [Pirellulales bacterium]